MRPPDANRREGNYNLFCALVEAGVDIFHRTHELTPTPFTPFLLLPFLPPRPVHRWTSPFPPFEYTEVGYPREGTRQTVCKSLNDVWVTSRSAPNGLYWNTTVFLNPVRAGFDQFVVQPHLQFVTLSS